MKITLPTGLVIEGTAEQIQEVLKSIGYKGIGDEQYYFSESKGPILIKEMNSMHLRNAILKMYKEWVDELHKEVSPKIVVSRIVEGITDKTWINMVTELNRREE